VLGKTGDTTVYPLLGEQLAFQPPTLPPVGLSGRRSHFDTLEMEAPVSPFVAVFGKNGKTTFHAAITGRTHCVYFAELPVVKAK
jgi:hypothetical protein